MDWNDVVDLATARLPAVEPGISYGTPALKVRGRLLTRYRPEDVSVTLHDVPPDERAMLIAGDPETFHTTPHYRDYPIVLARLAVIPPEVLLHFLERRWRAIAPKRLVAQRG